MNASSALPLSTDKSSDKTTGLPVPTVLQTLLFPGLEFAAPPEMYVRLNDNVILHMVGQRLLFRPAGRASFDTYFNGISVSVWKKTTAIDSMRFVAYGTGSFILRVGLNRIGHVKRWLAEHEIEFPQEGFISVEMPWAMLEDGLLHVALEARTEGTLTGGHFETRTLPMRNVKLGIVITHFNRKTQVIPAIRRISDQLLSQPEYENNIDLIVVDNSANLMPDEAAGATLIPNPNLGGSGGFTRGLLHLVDAGRFTHCLFMDDDASCEIESIRRGYVLHCFACSGALAVAGAFLHEVEPYRLFEKGARFDGLCRPLKKGLDMRNVADLIEADFLDCKPNYGGWWFFMFALADVRRYPFPFFVRGDDIQFSMINKFDILTMNGISCWGDGFDVKSGALLSYLDMRSHLVQQIAVLAMDALNIFSRVSRFFFLAALSYNYATARAVIVALRDVTSGPEFWRLHLDMNFRLAEISGFAVAEKMLPIKRGDYDVVYRPLEESKLRRMFRLATLNGFLLPSFILREETVFQHKGFTGTLRCMFRFKRVLYEYEAGALGYVACHDKAAFFRVVFDFARAMVGFARALPRLRKQYREALPELTSEAFWRGVYEMEARCPPSV